MKTDFHGTSWRWTMVCAAIFLIFEAFAYAGENLAAGKPYEYEKLPSHRSARDPGNKKLTDGGLPSSCNKAAGAINGCITLDMNKPQSIRTVMVYCVSCASVGIKFPRHDRPEHFPGRRAPIFLVILEDLGYDILRLGRRLEIGGF